MKKFIAVLIAALIAFSMLSLGGCEFIDELMEQNDAANGYDYGYNADVDMDELEEEVAKQKFDGLKYDLPDGFVYSEEDSTEDEQTYWSEDEYAFISVSYEECDDFAAEGDTGYFVMYTENVVQQLFEAEDVDNVEVLQFEKIDIEGFDAMHYEVSYEYEGIAIYQNVYEVYAGYDYVTYLLTQYETEDYTDAFEESIDDIEAIYKK
ncbi:MAG: hypothetical protein E7546_05465 [Ruminococcaceae bacterium]|nr:hypothetical protein [Oscillospiraceae bacterium]